ncbi:MAG TPA: phosphoribosyl-ATP diphosphatase [Spirochaetota bacterium]|nr:phosphoribosyl-ATP diphosphatase [Spirochaetota bacterium]HOM37746.1 phosphoribosyl-ATP diphosphatase [Spirochaetota bacterium]HPQ49377.1 phosphoribosyl-ATP diphosphatase [Spirochaetota bacterium]
METTLEKLEKIIEERKKYSPEESYTAKLINKGIEKILKKIGEEASELIIASLKNEKQNIIHETSDLFYHILVMLNYHTIKLEDIYNELEKRMNISGIEEKRRRKDD